MINDNDLSCLHCEDECSLGLNTGRLRHEESVLTRNVLAMVGLHLSVLIINRSWPD